ncbi:MAG: N-acetyltransferase family protein [Opitutaceae bacterium]
MSAGDWPVVAAIYREGIATGQATFASEPPATFAEWSKGKVVGCRVISRDAASGLLTGWSCLAPVSDRHVYVGVAEISVYVAEVARGRGVGDALIREVIARSEVLGIWTLQAGVFPENKPSIALHVRNGFREVGRRERIGKMTHGPFNGQWRDTVLLERRSSVAGRS